MATCGPHRGATRVLLLMSKTTSEPGDARQRPTLPSLARTEHKEEHSASGEPRYAHTRRRGQKKFDKVGCGCGSSLTVGSGRLSLPSMLLTSWAFQKKKLPNASERPRRPDLSRTLLFFVVSRDRMFPSCFDNYDFIFIASTVRQRTSSVTTLGQKCKLILISMARPSACCLQDAAPQCSR